MDEDPKEAVKNKEKASINIAAKLVNENFVDGIVSAGNTGATILAAAKHIPVIDGIEAKVKRNPSRLRHPSSQPGRILRKLAE